MTVTAEAPPERLAPDVGQLLSTGQRSPQCLCACEPARPCGCRCAGQFHGLLTGVPVSPSGTEAA